MPKAVSSLIPSKPKKGIRIMHQVEGPSGKGNGEGPGPLLLPSVPTGRGNGHESGRMERKQNQNPAREI